MHRKPYPKKLSIQPYKLLRQTVTIVFKLLMINYLILEVLVFSHLTLCQFTVYTSSYSFFNSKIISYFYFLLVLLLPYH